MLLLLALLQSASAEDVARYLKNFHDKLATESQDASYSWASRLPAEERFKSTLSKEDFPNPPGNSRHHVARIFVPGGSLDQITDSAKQYGIHGDLFHQDIRYSELCNQTGDNRFQFVYWTIPARESVSLNEAVHTRIDSSRSMAESNLLAIRKADSAHDKVPGLCESVTGKSMISEIATQWRFEKVLDLRHEGVYVEAQSVVVLSGWGTAANFLSSGGVLSKLAGMLDRTVEKMQACFSRPTATAPLPAPAVPPLGCPR
jgi:hypothetical protein